MEAKLSQTITAALGAAIVVIEGIQQLYQLQTNWILYRSTCESLRHEKYLFLGHAGPYAVAQDAHSLLAERIARLAGAHKVGKWPTDASARRSFRFVAEDVSIGTTVKFRSFKRTA